MFSDNTCNSKIFNFSLNANEIFSKYIYKISSALEFIENNKNRYEICHAVAHAGLGKRLQSCDN